MTQQRQIVYVGFDPREAAAFAVARDTIRRGLNIPVPIRGLVLSELQKAGLYTRPIEYRPSAADGPLMWDVISDAPMSTEHANARFLVPHLAKDGLALFVDGDVLARGNVGDVFWQASRDPSKAIWCVHHDYRPSGSVKMDGQPQTRYARKNWSSVILWNVDHPANKKLTLEMINTLPGRELHRFSWLDDSDIGELDLEWNYLVGESAPMSDPKIIHFTLGLPNMLGYEQCEYSDEWRAELYRWAI
jgi:hypothetical protein